MASSRTTRAARREPPGCRAPSRVGAKPYCQPHVVVGIARYKALNARRARKKTVDPEEALGGLADGADTPEITAQKVSKAEALRNCIAALPEEHRIVIDLVYYHETSVRDVAEILQVPENTVKTRMFNARRKLSALMQAAGLDRGWP